MQRVLKAICDTSRTASRGSVIGSRACSSTMAQPRSKKAKGPSQRHNGGHSEGDSPYITVVAYLIRPDNILSKEAQEQYDALQAIRREWDDAYPRWVPHVTLIPPFVVSGGGQEGVKAQLNVISDSIRGACIGHGAHEMECGNVGVFKLSRYRNVHLKPTESTHGDKLSALQKALSNLDEIQAVQSQEKKPSRQASRSPRPFSPHISLGQAYDEGQVNEISQLASRGGLSGLKFRVGSVALLSKPQGRSGSYDIWDEFPLGEANTGA